MRIGILGTGLMADALGGQWVKAGHDVFVGGRSPDRAATLADRIGAAHGSLREATAFGEVVLLAVPAAAAVDTVSSLAQDLAARILVDCTNAVDHKDFTLANPAMAETISDHAKGAHVVKAFNLAADSVWRTAPHDFEGRALGVPICGDDPDAVARVAVLARDLGCEPVPAGGLVRARLLEATAAFAIGVWVSGGDTRTLFPTIEHAF